MVDVTVNMDVEIDLDDVDKVDMIEYLEGEGFWVIDDEEGLLREVEASGADFDPYVERISDEVLLAEMINRGLELPEEV